MIKLLFPLFVLLFTACGAGKSTTPIDRVALINRNNPQVTAIDSLSSLSVGNGRFAFTVDVTGLQTFPERYSKGVPLGTQSQWGWHSFPNQENYTAAETLKDYDFGRGRQEPYAVQFKEAGRQQDAANWFRVNPHRLHLGILGFEDVRAEDITDVKQTLQLWNGLISSHYRLSGVPVSVETACHPQSDRIAVHIQSAARKGIVLRFPYPTGGHCDDACNWEANDRHNTTVVTQTAQSAVLKRVVDATTYYLTLHWQGKAELGEQGRNHWVLTPAEDTLSFTCTFSPAEDATALTATADETIASSATYWKNYWMHGAVVDFGLCKDVRARELERRVVLSQYLLAIQCAGDTPPQETGLTYNSWFGKFHLEMIWWHQAQFALWGHPELLDRTLRWYEQVEPVAREIARRQGFDGVRWMKMTDPSGTEAPSGVGSFLIWQQPHLIYLAELVYRATPEAERAEVVKRYGKLVQETADFMYSFASYDELESRFVLKGAIPAQETLRAAETVNPPFELSYWHFAMQTAQQWRQRMGEQRNMSWEELIDKLSPLAYNEDKLYLAAETAIDTYRDVRFTSDHMAVLGAVGILPQCKLIRQDYMKNTLHWIWDNWNWGKTWGWDYPMTAMNAARLGEPDKAVGALLMDKRTNTYLVNGHNYQDGRLRIYLPGNGGLLTAVAMMCAGWDGCTEQNPGFPKDGNWDVRWEGLQPMP